MRLNDLNDGSIKTLLILGLVVANLVTQLPHNNGQSLLPGNARDARAVFGASPNARITSDPQEQGKISARAPGAK